MKIVVIKRGGFYLGFILLILLSLFFLTQTNHFINTLSVRTGQGQIFFEPEMPEKGSLDEMYLDALMLFLNPSIEEAINNYYSERLGRSLLNDPWSNKVLYIRRPNGYRTFLFEIKLEVLPYYGPHNTVGADHITLTFSASGVEIKSFEHIRDFTRSAD